jgi:hypothetical protein
MRQIEDRWRYNVSNPDNFVESLNSILNAFHASPSQETEIDKHGSTLLTRIFFKKCFKACNVSGGKNNFNDCFQNCSNNLKNVTEVFNETQNEFYNVFDAYGNNGYDYFQH